MNKEVDLAIIGAGPAGMSAAIYGSRAGLNTVMIDSGAPGGKLLKTYHIANYPGVPEVNGADLAASMFEQSTAFGAEYMYGKVVEVNAQKEITLEDGSQISAKAVILAMGTQEAMMGISNEKANIGHGVSFCAVCDGAFFRDMPVIVVGSNNAAIEEANFLTMFASKVTILVEGLEIQADPSVQKYLENQPKIEVLHETKPLEVCSEKGRVTGLIVDEKGQKKTLEAKGIFPYQGQNPMSSALKSLDILDSRGYVLVDENRMTKVAGIYAAGDIIAKDLRQIVTATSDGAIAAQHANKMIKMKKY